MEIDNKKKNKTNEEDLEREGITKRYGNSGVPCPMMLSWFLTKLRISYFRRRGA